MDEERIKEAFYKIKLDTNSFKHDLNTLKNEFFNLNLIVKELLKDQTNRHIIKTDQTDSSTQDRLFKPLNHQISHISIRNEGVPTDRQTDQQTDRHIEINAIDEATVILDSLDNVKKEIRLKFKKLTDQELLIFSTIYQFDEEIGFSDYKIISQKLSLTESSIRDYVGRLIKKGVPIEKKKINNKTIQLSISPNLKKIATLSTILQLRDL